MRILIAIILIAGLAGWWWVGRRHPVDPVQFEQRLGALSADQRQLVTKALEECGEAVRSVSASASTSATNQGAAGPALPAGWEERVNDPSVQQQVREAWGQAAGRSVASRRVPASSSVLPVGRITRPGRLSKEDLVSIARLGQKDDAAAARYIEFLDQPVKVSADDIIYLSGRISDELIIKLIGASGRQVNDTGKEDL